LNKLALGSVAFFCIGLSACQRAPDTTGQLQLKIRYFQNYSEALTRCKEGNVDSILLCVKSVINLDTIAGIDQNVWEAYATARALFRNDFGPEAVKVIDDILPRTETPGLLFERAELLMLRSALIINTYQMEMTAEDLYRAADIYLQLGLPRKASSCYGSIANLQYNTANYLLAIENGLRAIDLLQNIRPKTHEDSIQLMQAYNTIGLGYFKQNNLDSALLYYDRSSAIATLLREEFWQGLVAGNVADIYLARGMVNAAIESYKNDIRISLKHDQKASAALSLLSIGAIHVGDRQLELGRRYYDSAYSLLSKTGPLSLSRYNYLMSQWYELKADPANAFRYYKQYIVFRDSVQSVQINSQLQQLQSQKRLEQQLANIRLLETENELKEKELTISRISVIGFLLVSLLLGGLLYFIRRGNMKLNELNQALENKVKKRTERLRKINQELDTYLYRASHDVRRPILTILGLVQVASFSTEAERVEVFDAIRKTATGMDKMLRKLQMAYELENEKKNERVRININEFITLKIEELQREYPQIQFEFCGSEQVIVESNINPIKIIVMNILENASIFSTDHGDRVTITVRNEPGFAFIIVKDHGIGIEPEFIKKIFDPYVRCSVKSTGSGLGLYLAMKAAKLIGGNITATSTVSQGSEFIVKIPA
jgi:signal transduction histidine kinase